MNLLNNLSTENEFIFDCITSINIKSNKDDVTALLEPFLYITAIPGKNIRNHLIMAFNHWLNVDKSKSQIILETIDMLHNASLLVDDIEDQSCLRRGQKAAHLVYGVPTTLNCANYIYFIALKHLQQLNDSQLSIIFTEQLMRLHHGQGTEIYWRDKHILPNEEQYRVMVLQKTGALFTLAIRLLQIFSKNTRYRKKLKETIVNLHSDFSTLIHDLGWYFQVRDDYLNLVSSKYAENKTFCEDITEGKYSFPIIHCLNHANAEQKQILLDILHAHTQDVALKKQALSIIYDTGSLQYTEQVLNECYQRLIQIVQQLGGNPILEALLLKLQPNE